MADDDLDLDLDHGAAFPLPLPPLSAPDKAFLRAVAARAAQQQARGSTPLGRLMAAYSAEAEARGVPYGLAPVYQGYVLRMAEGAGVDELLGEGGKRGMEKL